MIVSCRDWHRPAFSQGETIPARVQTILNDIRDRGDDAIQDYAHQFDGKPAHIITLKPFEDYGLDPALADSIQLAARRIEGFAQFQLDQVSEASFEDDYGRYSQRIHAIDRIGAYIPGGRFPLISTALMTLIPARVAGCQHRIASSPSDHPALLAAASLAGATEFRLIGGVQAIGAYAFGFGDSKAVDLVVGPGNAWVNEAKNQCQGRVKIDGLAGPSELLALCDANQPVEWLARDALAQAEHDPDACSLIVSDSRPWLEDLQTWLEQNQDGQEMLNNNQVALILGESVAEITKFSETYAPEHLMLCHQDIAEQELSNYGSLFVGANSAVALGDYITGPNHTLPTLGYARQTGGLNVMTFLRVMTVQEVKDAGRTALSRVAMPLAEAEGLQQHYASLKVRL